MSKQGSVGDQIRILQVVDKFSMDSRSIHGVARLLSWWVNEIDRKRFEFNILGLTAPNEAGRYLEEQGARVYYSDRGKLNPASLVDIVKVARQVGADILHLHGYRACTFGRIAGALLRTPVILHEHGAFPSVPFYQKVADWLLAPLGDKTIVVSEAVAEFCIKQRSISTKKIEVIVNGIPLDEFRNVSEAEVSQVAQELGINPDTPVIGTVARLDEEKGVIYFLNALPAIKAKVPGVKMLIVGDGTLRPELEEKASRLGMAEDVVFTGERRDVPRLYKLMDVKIISSIHEGGPLTLLEAMAADTPVVATPVGLVNELIEDGMSGVIVEPCNSDAIARAVVHLLTDGGRRESMADKARERVRKYDVRTSMRRIENIYHAVLQ